MSKLGIRQKADGTLEVDNKVLEKALKENGSSVKEFFAGDGKETGFATENFNYLKKTLDSREGTIHNATDGLEKRKKVSINASNKPPNRLKTRWICIAVSSRIWTK